MITIDMFLLGCVLGVFVLFIIFVTMNGHRPGESVVKQCRFVNGKWECGKFRP